MPRNVMALDSKRAESSTTQTFNRESDFENGLGRKECQENSSKRRESTGNLLADGEYHLHPFTSAILTGLSPLQAAPLITNCRTKRGRYRHESTDTDGSDTSSTLERAPPDGGWGWVVVGAAFLVNLIADGVTFSFGVFYVEFTKYFGKSKSATAWIGSLLAAMPLLSGPIASSLTDRFGCRKVTVAGSLLATTGFLLSSYADSIEMLYLTFGLITGFGLSLCYVAAVVIVAYYFEQRRSLATGLSVCGGGIGTFVFAPLTQFLIDEYGWRDATLLLSGAFLNLSICGVLMRDLEWTKKLHKSPLPPSVENEPVELTMGSKRLCNSAVCIPTFVQEQEKEKLHSTQKNFQLHSSPSIRSNSATVSPTVNVNNNSSPHIVTNDTISVVSPKRLSRTGTLTNISPTVQTASQSNTNPNNGLTTKSAMRNYVVNHTTTVSSGAGLHRHSLTYRGAVLSLKRYRLRPASSCPDIISVATIDDRSSHEWKAVMADVCSWFRGAREWKHLSNSRFLLFTLSNFLLYMWYDVPYMYLQDASLKMGYSDDNSSFLLSIVGLCNTVGNVLLGYIGDKQWADLILVYGVCMAVCGGISAMIPTLMAWNYAGLATGCGLFGLTIAANYSLTSVILVKVVSLERFTNAYGLLLLVQGLGNLLGPPIAGLIYDWTGTSSWSFVLAGCGIFMSSVFILVPKMFGSSSKHKISNIRIN